ncbi:MAG: GNAT family N-acetyltransferase, partial [Myxococcota bacterium]
FIRGAAMSRGGKPIIALPSTAKNGTISRIVPHLDEGAGVVTSRGDVHYVVTEYGVAYLHGKTIRERALALINVTHPSFRQDLLDFVRKKHYVYEDELVLRQSTNPYPNDIERIWTVEDQAMTVRPLRATDERRLQEFFYRLQPETVYDRFFAPKKELSHREAAELCCVDYRERMAIAAFLPQDQGSTLIAVARYFLDPRRNYAETAITVREDWQGYGLAVRLTELLAAHARSCGIRGFYSALRPSNAAVIRMHQKMGHKLAWDADSGLFHVEYRLDAPTP